MPGCGDTLGSVGCGGVVDCACDSSADELTGLGDDELATVLTDTAEADLRS